LNSKEIRALFKIDYEQLHRHTAAERLQNNKKRLEFFLLLSGVVFTSLLVFSNFSGLGKVDNFLISPLLLWAALRFGLFGTSLSTFIITIIAIWYSKEGYGEFYSTKATLAENLLSLQAYLITVSLSINTLAIIIARQRKTEYDLKIEKDYLDILMNQTPDTIYFKDVDSRFTRINKPQMEALGLTNHSEAIGKTDFDFFHPELADQFFTDEQKIIKSGEPIIGKIESVTDNEKRTHWFSTTKLPMKDPNGKIIGIVGVSRDITAIKKIEEELRELNSSKDRLFSIIAHDLKSPFMGLIGYSDLILEQFDELDKDQLRKWISDIHKSIHSIFKLIENLLSWSRLQTDKFEYNPGKVNLFECAAYGMNLVIANAKNKEIEIINHIQSDLFVLADENMLNSIIGNLLSNGIKFSHRGGKILINSAVVDHIVEVSVEDYGIGISPKDQSKIFSLEVSHTTRGTEDEKGTGLGLVLCKEMIERHGGKIRVESKQGKGTKFIFTLPVAGKASHLSIVNGHSENNDQ
ncbi:MAG: ATP-binding protein, partial [Bacteroidota bacterium]